MITVIYKTVIEKMSGFVRVCPGFVRSMSGRTPGHISLDMSGLSGLSGARNAKGEIMRHNLDGIKTKRPTLEEIPISSAINKGCFNVTMSIGQWDGFLQTAYDNGATLLEVDENEKPVKAYRKRMNT